MNELVLIRGLPGSGKSTLARSMKHHTHFEADMFFEHDGDYCFDGARLEDAHDWCQKQTLKALKSGENVVVSNTFVCLWEIQPYLNMGFPTRIIETKGTWISIHHIPDEVIEAMLERWDTLPELDHAKEIST